MVPQAGSRTWWCMSYPGGAGFESLKGPWRTAEAWHVKRQEGPLVKIQSQW